MPAVKALSRQTTPGHERKELTNQSDNSINHSGGARKKLEFDMLAESLSARKHPRSRILFIIFKSLFHLMPKERIF
jgi:hypothetical protein